jgi:hypothetical protein
MKVCKNNKNKKYKGDENTPLRNGFSASGEDIGTIKNGKNKIKYIVINTKNGKRWKKYIINKSPRGLDKTIKEFNIMKYITEDEIEKVNEIAKSEFVKINMYHAIANSKFYEYKNKLLPSTPTDIVFWAYSSDPKAAEKTWQYNTLIRECGYYQPLITQIKDKMGGEDFYKQFIKLTKNEVIKLVKEMRKICPQATPRQKYII